MSNDIAMSKTQILIVEDEYIVALDLRQILEGLGYNVCDLVFCGEDVIKKAEELQPNLILMDIKLKSELDGIDAAEQIRIRYDIPVVFLTAYSDQTTLQRAKVAEPFGYILKPFHRQQLHSIIEMALYKHQAQKKLQETERRLLLTYDELEKRMEECYALAISAGKVGVWDWNIQAKTMNLDRKLKSMIGYGDKELDSKINDWQKYIHPNDIQKLIQTAKLYWTGSIPVFEIEHRVIHRDKTVYWFLARGHVIHDDKGQPYRMIGTDTDITDIKKAEEADKKLKEKNIRAAAIVEAQENERRRIARELHDGLGQILTGIKFNIETFEKIVSSQNQNVVQRCTDISNLLNNAISEVQRISYNLMPRVLDDFGLTPALELICYQISQQNGIFVKFKTTNFSGRLKPQTETGLYRIVQEGLNNIVKHAKAKEAYVKLNRQDSRFILIIEDNGKGFLPDEKGRGIGGMGLMNMRERVDALNGTLIIDSKIDTGTKIIVNLPSTAIPQNKENDHLADLSNGKHLSQEEML